MLKKEKILIYQAMVRLFGNSNPACIPHGTIEQNGCGKMSDFDGVALRAIKQLGCNYIWYTGLLQQASATDYSAYGIPTQNPQVLKGKAGSPYAITDYYSVSCDLADNPAKRMEEFDALVERTHKEGLKMLIDFVPNHVARQYKSVTKPANVKDLGEDDKTYHQFDPQNNFYYIHEPLHLDYVGQDGDYKENPAKASGNDVFHAWPNRNDWYETVKLNYGVDYNGGGHNCFDPIPDTWKKMTDILLYWAAKGVDGFRCDMVFMVPVDFWHWAIPQVKAQFPNVIFIAEIYDPTIYRSYLHYGHFDYLYDKVGLYDTLRAIVECRESASAITHRWQEINDIQDQMLNFLENHDEQRIASDFFAGNAQKAFPAAAVSCLLSRNPFMLYFGQELGERGMDEEGFSGRDGRTTIFDYWSLTTMRHWMGSKKNWRRTAPLKEERDIREFYMRLFEICKDYKAISRGQMYDLTYCNFNNPGYDVHRQFAFLRNYVREVLLVVVNFDGEEKKLSINIPQEAWQYVKLESKNRHIEDLMTGQWNFGYHDINKAFECTLPAYGVAVYKFQ